MATRAEHVQWAKDRAIAELDAGGPNAVTNAFNSLVSDFGKHPETAAGHAGIELGLGEILLHGLSSPDEMRRWIEGCA